MKKIILLSLIATFLSFGAFADTKTSVFHCSFKLADHEQILQNLEILVDVSSVSGKYVGTWTTACDICKVMPQDFPLEGAIAGLQAKFKGTFYGSPFQLDIPLESLSPTKIHSATMTSKTIFNGKPVDGICSDQR